MKRYDLIVIGGGAAGLTVAAGAVSFGLRVALIEKEAQPGGDCLHYGCVPSKALIAAAKSVHQARGQAAALGLQVAGQVDFARVMLQVHSAIASIQPHDSTERFRGLGVEVIHGLARFDDPHHVLIDGHERIYGRRIVIATGSKPFIPAIPGLRESGFLTNETIFQLKKLPGRLVVIGAGSIGVELAQAFARLGSQVMVLEPSAQFMPKEERELSELLYQQLTKEMSIQLGVTIEQVAITEDGSKRIGIRLAEVQQTIEADAILLATGRRPNTTELALERAGVVSERGYIKVNERLQSSQSHIYAAGDVLDRFAFTHAAGMEGKQIVANAVFGARGRVKYDHVPWVIYNDPELFHLGMTEAEAREKHGESVRSYEVSLQDVDRFATEQRTDGRVKIITDRSGRILGAHALGHHAGDWMQQVVMAMKHGIRIGSISQIIHPYPSRAAAVQRVADRYWRERLFDGPLFRWMCRFVRMYWRFIR